MPLILLGAPLGNPDDASTRLRDVLASADIVAAEDTRRLNRLAGTLGVAVSGRVISYFEGNERRRVDDLLAALEAGQTVAVVTDGGMPSVSDPGFRLVRAAADAGIPVTCAPGPSAVTTALAISGLPCARFCFEGFPPRRPGERRAALAALADEPRTLIFFEAPHRLAGTLADLAGAFGAERLAAVCRELTKTYEEVRRGSLGDLAEWAGESQPRGEITIVVHGAEPRPAAPPDDATLAAEVADLIAEGTDRKAALVTTAARYGLTRRAVYEAVLRGRLVPDHETGPEDAGLSGGLPGEAYGADQEEDRGTQREEKAQNPGAPVG